MLGQRMLTISTHFAFWLCRVQGSGESAPEPQQLHSWALFLSTEVALNVFKARFCVAASQKEKKKKSLAVIVLTVLLFFPAVLLWKLFHSYSNIVSFKNRSPCLTFLWKMKEMPFCSKLNTAIICIIKIGCMYRICIYMYKFILIYCVGTKINRIRITVTE